MLILLSIGCTSCVTNQHVINNNETLIVSVLESENYSVISENPKKVKRGEDANFNIVFKDGLGYKSSSNGYYNDGTLTIDNVQFSETISISCVEFYSVEIDVFENCHYTVTSANPVIVEKGESAIFDIEFEAGYVFESTSFGYFKDGKLIIDEVINDLSISLTAKVKGEVRVLVFADNALGEIKINGEAVNNYYGKSGDVVVLEALPRSYNKFVCWSLNNYVTNQMPFSFERQYTIVLNDDINIYANFWSDKNDNTIIYYANGGSTICGDNEIYYPHVKGNHIRINTIQGSNIFYREGYQLKSWNTNADGSGVRIGLGSRVKINNSDEPMNLYAQWIKETNESFFDFELLNNSTYAITHCSSLDETIVIPKIYNSLPITVIKTESFINLPFFTIYLPENLQKVETRAFLDCGNFENLHFFDYLNIIPNDFSNNVPSKIYINANTDPCYIGSYQNAFARKTDLLTECDSKKIIFIGNSNTMYSIDGSLVAEQLNQDVLCYGVQSGIGVAWELACLKYYCKDDENTIVFCCEFGADTIGYFSEHKFYAAESNYDLLSAIDFTKLKFGNVFGAYTKFKELKSLATVTPYSTNDYNCDEYGCVKMDVEPYRSEDWSSSQININLDFYKNGGFDWAEEFCSEFTNSNIYISSCSFNKNSINNEIRNEFYSDYQQTIIDNVSYKRISKFEDYAFPGYAFTTDNYHLIYRFTIERTSNLIKDLFTVI